MIPLQTCIAVSWWVDAYGAHTRERERERERVRKRELLPVKVINSVHRVVSAPSVFPIHNFQYYNAQMVLKKEKKNNDKNIRKTKAKKKKDYLKKNNYN